MKILIGKYEGPTYADGWTERKYSISHESLIDLTVTKVCLIYISNKSILWIWPEADHEPTVTGLDLFDGAILQIGSVGFGLMANPLNIDKEPEIVIRERNS